MKTDRNTVYKISWLEKWITCPQNSRMKYRHHSLTFLKSFLMITNNPPSMRNIFSEDLCNSQKWWFWLQKHGNSWIGGKITPLIAVATSFIKEVDSPDERGLIWRRTSGRSPFSSSSSTVTSPGPPPTRLITCTSFDSDVFSLLSQPERNAVFSKNG